MVRSFSELTAEQRADFQKLQAEFWATGDAGRRGEILDEISGSFYGPEVVAFASRVMGLRDEALSLNVIATLAGNTSPSIVPVLEEALRDPSRNVRAEAILAASQVRDDAVVDFFGQAFNDRDPNVRMAGFSALDDQSTERRVKVLSRALAANTADVQLFAVGELQVESTPKSVEAIIPALDSTSPELREQVRTSLEFQLDQDFHSAADARTWWAANHQRYDANMALKE